MAKFRTPSGGVSAAARRSAEAKGDAMPGGRFPIRNASDLSNAKHDIGRVKPSDRPAVKAFINKRAKALGKPKLGEGKSERKRGKKDEYARKPTRYDHNAVVARPDMK